MSDAPKRWHHRPNHLFVPLRTYIVTGATLHAVRLFHDDTRLELLHDRLLETLDRFGWHVDAWVAMSNHCHFVATSPDAGSTVRDAIRELHAQTARELNRLDGAQRRRVWFQYWNSCISSAASYYARLRYVMYNPVKHGVVTDELAYPWGCAAWLDRNLDPSRQRRIRSYGCERVRVVDGF
jgi:putative transposase